MLEAMIMARQSTGGGGGGSFGLLAGGSVSGSAILATKKFAFATQAITAGGTLMQTRRYFAGTGNTTLGIFQGSYPNTNSGDKYTWSTDTAASATALSSGRAYMAACGPATYCMFARGWAGSG